MLILALRTDNPTAELYIYEDAEQLVVHQWQGHRQLAETLHTAIARELSGVGKNISDVTGLVAYRGPGSFTGLRIGLSVANALGYSNHCPVVGVEGPEWLQAGVKRLQSGENDTAVLPLYDAPVFTTKPRK